MNIIAILARVRPAVRGNAAIGAVAAIAGVLQANRLLMGAGIAWILISVAALVLTYVVDRGTAEMVIQGTIVDPRQPQLPDVQTHMHCTPELPQAA